MMQKTTGPFSKYIAAVLLFGTNGIVASQIALSSYEIVLTRTALGSLFLVSVFVMTRQQLHCWHNKRHLLYLIISGLAMGLNWMFLYEAYTQIGVSLGILACYCGPVIVMMLSPVIFREKMTAPKLLGFLAVLTGMFFVNAQALADGKTPWGLFCGVMSAVTYAVMVIFTKKAASITGIENAMWQLLISFATVAVFVGMKQGFAMQIAPADVAPILVLGIVNTGIGCYLYFSSIGSLPVQTVAICGYLEPLGALVFSALLLGEKLDAVQIVGAALILGGAAFGEMMGQRQPAFGALNVPGSAQRIRGRRCDVAPCRGRGLVLPTREDRAGLPENLSHAPNFVPNLPS